MLLTFHSRLGLTWNSWIASFLFMFHKLMFHYHNRLSFCCRQDSQPIFILIQIRNLLWFCEFKFWQQNHNRIWFYGLIPRFKLLFKSVVLVIPRNMIGFVWKGQWFLFIHDLFYVRSDQVILNDKRVGSK